MENEKYKNAVKEEIEKRLKESPLERLLIKELEKEKPSQENIKKAYHEYNELGFITNLNF